MTMDTIDIQNRVRRILIESPFALLSTVDKEARPHARWMSPIFASGDLKTFHCLAAPQTRKVAQIRENPKVSWVFAGPRFDEVVTIRGGASIDDDPMLRAEIWERMPDRQRAFILQNDENLEFVILRTDVEVIEYSRPREGQTRPTVLQP